MIEINIPGFGGLQLRHVICDFNGTLAVEGKLIDNIVERLNKLSEMLHFHVITGDTFGKAKSELANIHCDVVILSAEDQAIAKRNYIQKLGAQETVAIGNGRNDQYLLKEAALGIVIIGQEGAAIEAMLAANIIMPDIASALDALLCQKRLSATLRM